MLLILKQGRQMWDITASEVPEREKTLIQYWGFEIRNFESPVGDALRSWSSYLTYSNLTFSIYKIVMQLGVAVRRLK